jgi:zinc protease
MSAERVPLIEAAKDKQPRGTPDKNQMTDSSIFGVDDKLARTRQDSSLCSAWSSIALSAARMGRFAAGAFAALALVVAAPAWAAPKIHHWTEANGARVYFVAARELPMLQVSVVFDAGAARDPAGKNGLAFMTNALLEDGAGELDADAIATTLEGLGAQLSHDSQRDMAMLGLRTLVDAPLRSRALAVMARILAEPSFPEDVLERERRRALVGLKQQQQSPGGLASKRFYEVLYRGHPYAADPAGTERGLNAITRDDLVDFHRRHYVGNNAVLAMIGDVSVGTARKIARRLVGGLPAGEPAPPLPPVPALGPNGGIDRTQHPSSQSHIFLGEPGLTRDDPDYFPLYVGNHILGGSGLVSRISEEIREKRGLSYSAYSYFIPMRQQGPYILGLQTRNDQRDEALKVLRATVRDFVDHGPTAEELEAAKKNITGGFPLRIDSNRKIADHLAVIGFYRLPLSYLDDFIPKVEAVTVEQIRDAYRRRVDPDRMVTVIVGGGK